MTDKPKLIAKTDCLVLGGGIAALVCACERAAQGKRVLLLHSGTALLSEICDSADYRAVRITDGKWKALFFPPEVFADGGEYLLPDRLKRHAEDVLSERGISLLYACEAIDVKPGGCTAAHKSGLYGIAAGEVYDLRNARGAEKDSCALHCIKDGRHEQLICAVSHTGDDARSVFLRYEEALKALPEGAHLARGGAQATVAAGIDADAPVRAGLSCTPVNGAPEQVSAGAPVYDVIVAGGGTAGAPAAIFCARQGLKTLLLEMNHTLGGTATAGGVSTYWFGLRSGAARQIDEAVAKYRKRLKLPAKPGLWNDDDGFYPDLKAHALLGMCLEAGCSVEFGCTVCGVLREDERISGVYYAQKGLLKSARARFTLDCTGDGDVCVLAGADYTYGSEADGMTYWASLAQYPTADSYKNNFSTMVNVGDVFDYTRFIIAGRRLGGELYDHGSYVAVRESRHIRGCKIVTLKDLLLMKTPEDALYSCFSNYDPKGRLTSDICYAGLLPPNQMYTIPRGACVPVDKSGKALKGLLVGGKAISCTHDAFPGIRMQSDLERQGLALAALAGQAICQNTDALSCTGVKEKILALGGDFSMPDPPPLPALAEAVAALRADEAWEWLDASVNDCASAPSPVIRILCSEAQEVLPLLKSRYAAASDHALRLLIARLMLFHGCGEGADAVVSAVRAALAACPQGLPERSGSLNYAQMLPDHGIMPEPVYLVNSLARCPDTDIEPLMREIYLRIVASERDWYSLKAGIYCWIETFPYTALRRRDKALIPYIKGLLRLPEFTRESEDPLLDERLHMLRTSLLNALYRLGDAEGGDGLRRYLSDRRAVFRTAAEKLLKADG
ncbi:MAG: FAD-dependent oxidoreductase [Clostridia bacterium]|nr:FAD-dependent oxidoreductase [Clostridia bacterium]